MVEAEICRQELGRAVVWKQVAEISGVITRSGSLLHRRQGDDDADVRPGAAVQPDQPGQRVDLGVVPAADVTKQMVRAWHYHSIFSSFWLLPQPFPHFITSLSI